jgi:hypothetical protein
VIELAHNHRDHCMSYEILVFNMKLVYLSFAIFKSFFCVLKQLGIIDEIFISDIKLVLYKQL